MDDLLLTEFKDRFETNRLGEIAIAKVLLRAIEKGWGVSRPQIECRYDLILDDGLKLYRTQVKYAGGSAPKQCRGVVPVGLEKWRTNGRKSLLGYTEREIDLLLVYVPKLDRVLCFGPEVFVGRRKLFIRIEPASNNQVKGCLMAEQFIW